MVQLAEISWVKAKEVFDETDVVLSVILIERETEQITDSVSTSLVAPAVSSLPPTWPGTPGTPGTTTFDWSSVLAMMFPIMMLGVVTSAAKPAEERKEVRVTTEERKLLPPGREE